MGPETAQGDRRLLLADPNILDAVKPPLAGEAICSHPAVIHFWGTRHVEEAGSRPDEQS